MVGSNDIERSKRFTTRCSERWAWASRCASMGLGRQFRLPACVALLASPVVARASDPTELAVMLYGALAIVFAVVFSITWVLTSLISKHWLKVSIRVAVVFLFWTPVPIGGAGYWWPAPFA